MAVNKTLLALALTAAMLAGCKKKDAEPAAEPAAPSAETTPATDAAPADAGNAATAPENTSAPAAAEPAQPQAEAVKAFDINSVAVSDKPLGEWPYVVPPAGYELDSKDELAKRTRDLARVPVWTGSELLWVEGKVFTDEVDNSEGKTYSKFEARKGIQQAVEALGGKRISERYFDDATERANSKDLNDFGREFHGVYHFTRAGSDVDTYALRRADKVIWVVYNPNTSDSGLMVVEAPLPEPAK